MLHRVLSLAAALALLGFVGASHAADKTSADKSDSDNAAIRGTLDKVGADSITVTDNNGKEHTMTVDKSADVTCDGKECKLSDLKKGVMVRVTAKRDDRTVAEKVEASTASAKDKSDVKDK